MEIRVLKYFLEVANLGTITAAANKLNITQPALSKQIKVLENDLGVKLLDREKKPLRLTNEGIYLAKQAETILNLTEKTILNIKSNDVITGEITIGAAETPLFSIIIAAINTMQNVYPNVTINLVSGSLNDLLDRLNHGLLDFLFALDFNVKGQYDFIDLPQKIRRGAYLNLDHPESNQISMPPNKLLQYPLIISRNPIWKDYLGALTNKTINELNIKMTFNLIGNAILYPKLNSNVMLIGIEGLIESPEIKFIPLDEKTTSTGTIIWNHTPFLSALHEEFIYYLNRQIDDLK
ncbi:LysR family transcriptional regulator [Weissella koreensis]|uniref:LysR family transcriptional regulator n=1 Tax=Weissella koreensis TaxID=165096 RepID=UPI00026F3658|nr:LysR family transcriptional regulator [Weissella koreensis]AVH75262.1 LysR family transcriptional regulator [Weissella koreensis]EJF33296.1 hypothetical protein JC2156_10470 [Weissella koreensis KCTC 3621]QGN20486.1 LysR family transcriptional regulator [Weissella koreensis]